MIALSRVYVLQIMLCGHHDLMLNKMAFDKFSGLSDKGSLPELIKFPGNRWKKNSFNWINQSYQWNTV